MDESRAISLLSHRFPNKSHDYLRTKYRQCNSNLNATITAIGNEPEEAPSRGFLDSLLSGIAKFCCCIEDEETPTVEERPVPEVIVARQPSSRQRPQIPQVHRRTVDERPVPQIIVARQPASRQRPHRPTVDENDTVYPNTLPLSIPPTFFKASVASPQSASNYREQAQQHLKRKRELNALAHQYKREGKYKLANGYFEAAKQQGRLHELANSHAAVAFLEENHMKNPSKGTIDLHGLYVKEAIQALDVFLDDEIRSLRDEVLKRKMLRVITGRGKHSEGGIPKVKIAVIERLKDRNLLYSEINAGQLRVHIYKNSQLSNDLP